LALTSTASTTHHALFGVNIAGGEFGKVGQAYGTGYIYPSHAEIDYYASKHMDVIRVPFLWERVQHSKFGALDGAELARLDDVVKYASGKGMHVDLDMHNYGYGFGAQVGSAQTPNSAFADVWGKLAGHYAGNDKVMFGLMNEPHDQSATSWIGSVNAAVSAVRGAGAHSQTILVSGTYWDGAHSWVSTDNDTVVGNGVKDPDNRYALEVHQYLDSNNSGTSTQVVSPTIGAERLAAVTKWATDTHHQLFLGEFGAGKDAASIKALDTMLASVSQHQDVWAGATYWAGGPWWGSYAFSVEPQNGHDAAQMPVLQHYADLLV
jgi:endoglucanase